MPQYSQEPIAVIVVVVVVLLVGETVPQPPLTLLLNSRVSQEELSADSEEDMDDDRDFLGAECSTLFNGDDKEEDSEDGITEDDMLILAGGELVPANWRRRLE